jgi:hypothetical protein
VGTFGVNARRKQKFFASPGGEPFFQNSSDFFSTVSIDFHHE